jgi:hypothetical protein
MRRVPPHPPTDVPYSVWGWGVPGQAPTADELGDIRSMVVESLGFPIAEPRWGRLDDPPTPRVTPPASLRHLSAPTRSTAPGTRWGAHTST